MSDIAKEQASGLIQHFAEATAAVLSQISGTALQARAVDQDTATQAATLIRIEINGALEGICEIALSSPMTAEFAAMLMGETADLSDEITSDTREAAVELIQQICGAAADRLRGAFGQLELKPKLAECDPENGAEPGERHLIIITGQDSELELELRIVELAVEQKPAEKLQSTIEAEPGAATEKFTAAEPAISNSGNRNLDLLLDIELGVTLRFGTRQMLLKDIVELCSGSVVELDRPVRDPVDLLIDGRLIAQGEVVVIEGNYGLRITQVATQGDRIACLP